MVALDLEDFGGFGARKSAAERKREAERAEARGEGHAAGYAEGFAAAAAQARTEERAAVAELLERARDLDLARADARAAALEALGPVVSALARLAAPRAARAGLAEDLAAAVRARLDAAPHDALEAHVAPDLRAAVAETLGEAAGEGVAVRADPALGPTEARLDWPGGGLIFDADAAVAAAERAIGRFFGTAEQEAMSDVG